MKLGMEFWAAHVAATKLEGVSTNVYAKRQGISVAALYSWQRKLTPTPEMGEPGKSAKFVALRVADALVVRSSPSCTLVMPSEMRLEMSALPAPGSGEIRVAAGHRSGH